MMAGDILQQNKEEGRSIKSKKKMSSDAENKRENCSSGKDVLERTWTVSQTFRKREGFCKGKTTFMELCRYFQLLLGNTQGNG
jgi:hypothetical protein